MFANDIDGIVNGNEISFEHFMKCHSDHLFHYAYGIIKSKEAAEEIVSDVFLEVWKSRNNLYEINNIKSWLLTVTYRKSISYLRKMPGSSFISIDDKYDFLFEPMRSPADDIISKEAMDKINRAIQSLPPKCKHVFFLAKVEKMPYKQIAEMLDISVKTINNHIAMALEKISVFLKKEE